MDHTWIGVIGTLLGVSIGGLVSYLVNSAQFKRDKKLKDQQLIQQKLEEICKTAEEIHTSSRELYAECYGFISLSETFNLDNIKNLRFSYLNMLIYFYAPNLKEISQVLSEAVNLHSIAIIEMIGKVDPTDKQIAFLYVSKANQLIDKLCTAIIHSSANIVRDHFDN